MGSGNIHKLSKISKKIRVVGTTQKICIIANVFQL